MRAVRSRPRNLLLAALAAGVAATAVPAFAQQPTANPTPPTQPPAPPSAQPGAGPGSQTPTAPPPWAQGRPDNPAVANLAPVAPPPIPTPADKLPLAKLKLPKGFNLEVYAAGLTNARSLRVDDRSNVYVSTRLLDRVYAVGDKNGKKEVKTIATGLNSPNGIALHNGTLYIAEINKISKIDNVADRLDNTPKPTVIYDDLPSDAPHGWKFLTVGPDNKLYFNIGAPCNICMPSDRHAQIRRINLDGSGAEVVARGIRQIVGFDWHPTLKMLYFTENQRDWLSEDQPQDKLNRLLHPGQDNFGSPIATAATFPTRNSAGATAATSSPSRSRNSGRILRRSACGSTPARCSRRNTVTQSSLRATAHGTRARKSAAMSSSPGSTRMGRSSGSSRSSPASSRTTIMSAGRSTWSG
jgi:glucose/arabinose dehydrogenase